MGAAYDSSMNLANRLVVLLLVAVTFVVAGTQPGRAGAHGARAVEICAGDSITIIHVDAQGRQVPAAPLCDCAACKHCAMPALALLPVAAQAARASGPARRMAPQIPAFGLPHAHRVAWQARGPPAPKAMT